MRPELSSASRATLLIAIVAGLLIALHIARPPAGGLWLQVFLDSLHVPVFGLIAICIYLAQRSQNAWQKRALFALVITAILGALSEAAQIFTARDASLHDLVADCVGAVSFLAMFLAIAPPGGVSRPLRLSLAATSLVLLGWILAPLAIVGAAFSEQLSQFPVIARFDSQFGQVLKRTQNVDYRIVDADADLPEHALVTLQSKPWPGVAFHNLRPDWSEYSTLIVDIGIDGNELLPIHLRVHDELHESSNKFSDRFNRSFSLQPGRHELRIPLADLVQAPRSRTMDLTRISELIVFSDASHAGRSFKLYEIRLE